MTKGNRIPEFVILLHLLVLTLSCGKKTHKEAEHTKGTDATSQKIDIQPYLNPDLTGTVWETLVSINAELLDIIQAGSVEPEKTALKAQQWAERQIKTFQDACSTANSLVQRDPVRWAIYASKVGRTSVEVHNTISQIIADWPLAERRSIEIILQQFFCN